jgi:positive regulator of sigma E activity
MTDNDRPPDADKATWARVRSLEKDRALAPGIYGTIICGSVLAAVDQQGPVWRVVVSVLVTVLVYWLAERYSELLAAHARGERVTRVQLTESLRAGWPMVQASYTPLLVLVVAKLLGATTATAISIAVFSTAALLVGLGWLAGKRSGQSGWALTVTVAFAGGLGLVIIALKYALH